MSTVCDGIILGLDGGTTSTVCECMKASMNSSLSSQTVPVLSRARAGCTNHNSVGKNAAGDALEKIMAEALSKVGSDRSAAKAVCLSLSGVNHSSDQERILGRLRYKQGTSLEGPFPPNFANLISITRLRVSEMRRATDFPPLKNMIKKHQLCASIRCQTKIINVIVHDTGFREIRQYLIGWWID